MDELGQAFLDLRVEDRATKQTRPARVRPPLVQIRRDGFDDLALQVETQVVAGREVREPPVAHADHATVDLLDHRIAHGMRASELVEVMNRRQPFVDPGMSGQRGTPAGGCGRSHPSGAVPIDRHCFR